MVKSTCFRQAMFVGLFFSACNAGAEGSSTQAQMNQYTQNYNREMNNPNLTNAQRQELTSNYQSDIQNMQNASSGSSSKAGSSGGGFYQSIDPYRRNDPFLFCNDGQDTDIAPDRCWWPIAPYTGGGAWVMNPICRPPNPYGKDWTSDDWTSLGYYLTVCPQAGGKSGEWKNPTGKQKNMVPFKH